MFSLEPFTLRDIGSPQVFQTGETFNGAPLIDYQHPHDLIMNLGGAYSRAVRRDDGDAWRRTAVGPAPIGPPVFMHRPSAIDNPQAPLSHHYLDATHITPGVVSIGVERSGFSLEAGAFHGQEPDENRLDLDTAALDSYSVRASWADGPWQFQISGADLKTPERKSPYDATRLTASASYFKGDERRSIAWTGGVRPEPRGVREARGVPARSHEARRHERVLHARRKRREGHPRRRLSPDRRGAHASPVACRRADARLHAATSWPAPLAPFGLGGDITGYLVPANLKESYGSPWSFHVFIRYRGRVGARIDHIH